MISGAAAEIAEFIRCLVKATWWIAVTMSALAITVTLFIWFLRVLFDKSCTSILC